MEVGGLGEFVRVEVADGIATIRLDRPKMKVNSRLSEPLLSKRELLKKRQRYKDFFIATRRK